MADAAKSAKLSAELTDEGDIFPLPFKGRAGVQRAPLQDRKNLSSEFVGNGLCAVPKRAGDGNGTTHRSCPTE